VGGLGKERRIIKQIYKEGFMESPRREWPLTQQQGVSLQDWKDIACLKGHVTECALVEKNHVEGGRGTPRNHVIRRIRRRVS